MIINKNEITNLCKVVCEEFKSLGFQKDIHPKTLKESYNVSKHADGSWFKSTKASLHEPATNSSLDLTIMPSFKKITDSIDEMDPEFKKIGGRIFITENLVYKIKKGTEYPLLYDDSPEISNNCFDKLCEEISSHGHEKDRYRTEETYIISKAANGEWSMSSTHENLSGTKKTFNLTQMPQLKIIATKINKIDPAFQANGGRIFITPTRIYRIKNKIELDFNFKSKKFV
jgi:hypothetical protein